MALAPSAMARLISYYLKDFKCCVKVKLHVCFSGILLPGRDKPYVQELRDSLTVMKDEMGPRDEYNWGTEDEPEPAKSW